MTIGERIKARRLELGLTQEELAEIMGYKSKAAISNVEKGKEDLTTARVQKFATALKLSPADLMEQPDTHERGNREVSDYYFELASSSGMTESLKLLFELSDKNRERAADYIRYLHDTANK